MKHETSENPAQAAYRHRNFLAEVKFTGSEICNRSDAQKVALTIGTGWESCKFVQKGWDRRCWTQECPTLRFSYLRARHTGLWHNRWLPPQLRRHHSYLSSAAQTKIPLDAHHTPLRKLCTQTSPAECAIVYIMEWAALPKFLAFILISCS